MMNEAIEPIAPSVATFSGASHQIEFSPSFFKIMKAIGELDIENPTRNKKGEYGLYADLPAILSVIKPATKAASIYFSQFPLYDVATNRAILLTVVTHEDEWIRCYSSCLVSNSKRATETPMQAWGAAETYLRRTSLCGIFNLAQDDADHDGSEVAESRSRRGAGAPPSRLPRDRETPVRESTEEERTQAIAAIKNAVTMEALTAAYHSAKSLSPQEGWHDMVKGLASKRKQDLGGTAAA